MLFYKVMCSLKGELELFSIKLFSFFGFEFGSYYGYFGNDVLE